MEKGLHTLLTDMKRKYYEKKKMILPEMPTQMQAGCHVLRCCSFNHLVIRDLPMTSISWRVYFMSLRCCGL